MGKSVLGKFKVFFSSSGTLELSPKWLIFNYREQVKARPSQAGVGTKVMAQGG
jgi:hypothetical protein